MKSVNQAIYAGLLISVISLAMDIPRAMASGDAILQSQCASCHAITESESNDISERLTRKAPPLHFAGNKYQREWLQNWLTEPEPIHPAGYFPNRRIINTEDGDQINPEAEFKHPTLSRYDANTVSEAMMTLRSRDDLINADSYQPGTVAMRMGVMDFRRFKGCDACHQDSTTSGGLSGPVLYDAAKRLQPAYLSSFIQNPVAWDNNTTMPVLEMNEAAVHRLVHYLMMLEGDK